ncbi:MAG: hypothetical protein JXR64_08975 [Spirochaetales bacterium]|nr:hypothetical protein [Spirochaetales bacterium]
MDKSSSIFSNKIKNSAYKKSVKTKAKFIKRFGDDSTVIYNLKAVDNRVLGPILGVKDLVLGEGDCNIDPEKSVLIGNIRMGFGHYRISMAIASAARHLGYTPYWFDLNSFTTSTGGKVIAHLNKLYSLGSRLSQKYKLFNKFYWEPLNSEGFRKLEYNSSDQKVSELMVPLFKTIPKNMPCIATHVWPAQGAVHSGIEKVINVIPDNWPMALHLAEGSIHTVQTPSSFFGYKTLNGMAKQILNPMPSNSLYEVGHYIDHEIVSNLEDDCFKRIDRLKNGKALRFLLTIGGAGAQRETFEKIIKKIIPFVKLKKAVLFINVGDHEQVLDQLINDIPELKNLLTQHSNNWDETFGFTQNGINSDIEGIHSFYNTDIFAAVYSTNLLMRISDILITKPSELSFYPVPKLLIKRVGGHEAWGAVRAAEIGDGTIECDTDGKIEQMLDLIFNEDDILEMMVNNILKAHKIGVYNGAYRVVELLKGDR